MQALRDQVNDHLGAVDILVNNAGRGAYGPFVESRIDELESVILWASCRRLAFSLRRWPSEDPATSCLYRALGELPAPDHAVYGCTKFAVTDAFSALAIRVRRHSPRLFAILLQKGYAYAVRRTTG